MRTNIGEVWVTFDGRLEITITENRDDPNYFTGIVTESRGGGYFHIGRVSTTWNTKVFQLKEQAAYDYKPSQEGDRDDDL